MSFVSRLALAKNETAHPSEETFLCWPESTANNTSGPLPDGSPKDTQASRFGLSESFFLGEGGVAMNSGPEETMICSKVNLQMLHVVGAGEQRDPGCLPWSSSTREPE